MLGKDIKVGTSLLWLTEVGNYYRATVETVRTVKAIEPYSGVLEGSYKPDFIVRFHEDNYQWYILNNKEYAPASAYSGQSWLDGDPNNPL